MKKPGTLKTLALVLILVVLLPALFYSGYELTTLTRSEELIGSIYEKQLDVILTSVNQYAWDITGGWANQLGIIVGEQRNRSEDSLRLRCKLFLATKLDMKALALSDTSFRSTILLKNGSGADSASLTEVMQCLKANNDKIQRLLRYRQAEYRKIEPIPIGSRMGLTYIAEQASGLPLIVTMVIDEDAFIRDVLAMKLQETAGAEFVVAVFRENADRPVTATSPVAVNELKQKKALWIFPQSFVGIRLKGSTVEELVHSRFSRNFILIIVMDVVLAIGAWIVYRSIRKEMELVRLKSDFVSNVSHELRTPLALIRMHAETLEMGRLKTEEKKKEYYATILQETERLTRLINNILNFSRMEAGRKEYHKRPSQLNDLISAVLETYGTQMESEGFHPLVALHPALPEITIDPESVTEALINILDNAMKYSKMEKYLRIATGTDSDHVFIEVEDHGVGIAPKHQEKIFETFYRVSDSLVHDTKGSGLGLALVKHIMDAHQGKVIVKSELRRGSIFRLEFPAGATRS